ENKCTEKSLEWHLLKKARTFFHTIRDFFTEHSRYNDSKHSKKSTEKGLQQNKYRKMKNKFKKIEWPSLENSHSGFVGSKCL
uniref:Uncharacterized protein n=1 Tax=Oryzias latipes TaxID=8090 RepID=A0A3B3ICH2_ORYLA